MNKKIFGLVLVLVASLALVAAFPSAMHRISGVTNEESSMLAEVSPELVEESPDMDNCAGAPAGTCGASNAGTVKCAGNGDNPQQRACTYTCTSNGGSPPTYTWVETTKCAYAVSCNTAGDGCEGG
jgi:hypothetical protein